MKAPWISMVVGADVVSESFARGERRDRRARGVEKDWLAASAEEVDWFARGISRLVRGDELRRIQVVVWDDGARLFR